jgi:DNA (cytosine-5)-methyltransferase 1
MDLRSLRIDRDLKQRDVAAAVGVPARELGKWERGLADVPPEALAALAAVLGVDPQALKLAQSALRAAPTAGEGYTTSRAGAGEIVPRRAPAPAGALRVLDLFCGAGGLSFGFEQAGGFVTTGGIDLLPDRIATFTTNHAHATGISADIAAFPLDALAEAVGPTDVIVGGPPCQGFSSIRPFRTLTEGDARNTLAEHYILVLARLRPRWFVFENVVGLLTHEGGARLRAVLAGLTGAGYTVTWRVLNAASYGVPQNRERVVIVGSRDGVPFLWPRPTHRHDARSMAGPRAEVLRAGAGDVDLPRAVTLDDAIGDLPPVPSGAEADRYAPDMPPRTAYQARMRVGAAGLTLHRATSHSAKMLNIIRHAGANIHALPPGLVTSGFSSCYSRLDADTPSTTLTVNFVHPASNRCIHPTQDRALTPREGARVQSFPDRFVFRGSAAHVVRQIGNAVPPLVGEALARAILASEAALLPDHGRATLQIQTVSSDSGTPTASSAPASSGRSP